MCGEDLLLLFEHAGHFLLECEELLFVVPAHRALHCVYVLTNLFLVLVAYYVLDLNLLLDFLGLLHRGYFWSWSGFFDRICAIFILVQKYFLHLFYLFCILDLSYLLGNLFRDLFWRFTRLRGFLFFEWIDHFGWQFI